MEVEIGRVDTRMNLMTKLDIQFLDIQQVVEEVELVEALLAVGFVIVVVPGFGVVLGFVVVVAGFGVVAGFEVALQLLPLIVLGIVVEEFDH